MSIMYGGKRQNTLVHMKRRYDAIQHVRYNTYSFVTILFNTIQHSTAQHSTALHSTVQYSTVQYSTVQCSAIQHSTIQYNTVQYSTAQHSTERYSISTVQHSTAQNSTVQCNTVQYRQYNVIHWSGQAPPVTPPPHPPLPFSLISSPGDRPITTFTESKGFLTNRQLK